MGDGLISVLNILLKTREVKNGILLIDEIENGLHWKTQKVLWKALLMATKENNIQIIATTHSLDTIKYLSEAYEEYLNEASKEEKNLLGEDEARVFSLYKKDKSFVEKIDSQSLKTMITHHYEIR
jgi:AAA15 family ATPase/GTPase